LASNALSGANDAPLDTIRALVEHGTYAIDDIRGRAALARSTW